MGTVHVYTGNGGGKTTSTLGLALRSTGWKHKTIMIQFLKGRKGIGEWKAAKRLAPYFEIYSFGSPKFVNPYNPSRKDFEYAKQAIEFARKVLKEKKPDLLILDEANIAMDFKLVKVEDVLKLIKEAPKKTRIVLTGRHAPKKIREIADFVTEIRDIKRPSHLEGPLKGIEY
ncbi:MAG: cob(I)yrinic acid a,c-diamide adenosyltransferase [Candidatus Micrarchaeia archaeon]|jgi:cob(I)alamin adenosyltransferase